MWKTFLKQLRHNLRGERGVRLVVIIGVAGLGLILLSGFFPNDKAEPEESIAQAQEDTSAILAQYCNEMEHQLSDVLMQIDGVGNCQVMVRADAGAQYIYVQNQEIDTQDIHTQEKQDVVLLSDSDGEYALTQQVMEPQISGVIVVCEGASSNIVKEHVTNAVQALLGISANRICIVPSAS